MSMGDDIAYEEFLAICQRWLRTRRAKGWRRSIRWFWSGLQAVNANYLLVQVTRLFVRDQNGSCFVLDLGDLEGAGCDWSQLVAHAYGGGRLIDAQEYVPTRVYAFPSVSKGGVEVAFVSRLRTAEVCACLS